MKKVKVGRGHEIIWSSAGRKGHNFYLIIFPESKIMHIKMAPQQYVWRVGLGTKIVGLNRGKKGQNVFVFIGGGCKYFTFLVISSLSKSIIIDTSLRINILC